MSRNVCQESRLFPERRTSVSHPQYCVRMMDFALLTPGSTLCTVVRKHTTQIPNTLRSAVSLALMHRVTTMRLSSGCILSFMHWSTLMPGNLTSLKLANCETCIRQTNLQGTSKSTECSWRWHVSPS